MHFMRHCSDDFRLSSYHVLMLPSPHALVISSSHIIMLSCWHVIKLLCSRSRTRGAIVLLYFPVAMPVCSQPPSVIYAEDTIPYCLASRSLIVQVFAQALIRRKYGGLWYPGAKRVSG